MDYEFEDHSYFTAGVLCSMKPLGHMMLQVTASISTRFLLKKTLDRQTVLNDPRNFQFALVSDRTGGVRAGIFPTAVKAK